MMSKAALEQELAHTQAKMEASDSDRTYLRDEVERLKRDRDEQKAKLSDAELAGSRAASKLETANTAAARSESRLKELQVSGAVRCDRRFR
jgi:chromosome segregation ATPase